MSRDSLGDRIKRYERVSQHKLTPRTPLFVRVDGKSFHTFTRFCNKPFDLNIISSMTYAGIMTAHEMTGFVLGYVQSDECTFMLQDYENLDTQGWFDYELNKIVSITASAFTAYFNKYYFDNLTGPEILSRRAMFDARAFTVPIEDAPNVFIWRQRDWERNSIQMLARAHLSHKELEGVKNPQIHEMLHEKGVNWAHLEPRLKNGTFILQDKSMLHDKLTYDDYQKILALSKT